MAYRADIYHLANANEYEYKFAGHYGAKGEKRSKRRKATPEQVERQNRINRENKMRRLIAANFLDGDLWITLKYPKGTKRTIEQVKKDLEGFRLRMKRDYRKRGEVFKWIQRIEIGKQGGVHAHMIANNIYGADLLIAKNWGSYFHTAPLREEGNYRRLAGYIVKDIPEEVAGQLSLFDKKDKRRITAYSSSRNLIRPEPERRTYVRRTMRDIIKNGPKAKPGYYIDKDSIRIGVNQCTGYSYVHYTEIRVERIRRKLKPPAQGG